MPINNFLLPGAKVTTAYKVANSCRFNDGDLACMHKTPSSSGNRRTFTFSTWVKKTNILSTNVYNDLYSAYVDANNISRLLFWDGNEVVVSNKVGGSFPTFIRTNRRSRDPSAWLHICIAIDTTDSTEANRVKIYVNGTQQTSFAQDVYPSQNEDFFLNHTNEHNIGQQGDDDSALYFDGYLAETVMIDGLQLAPTSFGEFDEDSPNIWKPKDVSGLTFGTNGFYLDYEDSSNLGNDKNGGTDFTEVNLATTDQSTDTPTLNYSTLNPLDVNPSNTNTFAEGNLKLETNGVGARSTIAVENGRLYCEVKHVENTCWNGIKDMSSPITGYINSVLLYTAGATLYIDGANQGSGGYGGAWSANDILMMALDLESGTKKLYYGKNGNWWDTDAFDAASPTTGITLDDNVTYGFWSTSGSGDPVAEWNFGSPAYSISSGNSDANGYGNFEYSVPSNYYALNTKNLAEYG